MNYPFDMADVKGHPKVKSVLEDAAVDGKAVLLVGPPGCGKTMLARRFNTILPDLSRQESAEVGWYAAAAGLSFGHLHPSERPDENAPAFRPFRAPHHTVSAVGLVGGGYHLRPGEIALAHNGTLLLDEAHEFSRLALEHVAHALTNGHVRLNMGTHWRRFPVKTQLIVATTSCPCGWFGFQPQFERCHCRNAAISLWERKINILRPLFGHIARVEPVSYDYLINSRTSEESSATIRRRVEARREAENGRPTQMC